MKHGQGLFLQNSEPVVLLGGLQDLLTVYEPAHLGLRRRD